MLLKFGLFVLISVSINIYSQVYESIEKKASEYFINLSNKSSGADSDLIKLKDLLFNSYIKLSLRVSIKHQFINLIV